MLSRWLGILLLAGGMPLGSPVWAQPPASPLPAQPELTPEQVLQACATDQADQLPNPFSDVSPQDWAYQAVLTLYYCGAYRGAIPPADYQRFWQEKSAGSPG
ncbi:MAG: hypothetical protein NW237_17680 [Cyanobacteriota bacterium]|nr:hypothetical protein [Cyanobacteriota bacterium]